MCVPFLLGSPSAPMTFPRANRPLLIWMLSFSLSPVFPVRRMLGFIWVAPVCLAVFPDSNKLRTSSRPSTSLSFTPQSTVKSNIHTLKKKKNIHNQYAFA
uniref:Uncharacterized protein n=1 Tax=Myripristis murdjan TaxID=586833 RepID=A0A667Z013_9TELE